MSSRKSTRVRQKRSLGEDFIDSQEMYKSRKSVKNNDSGQSSIDSSQVATSSTIPDNISDVALKEIKTELEEDVRGKWDVDVIVKEEVEVEYKPDYGGYEMSSYEVPSTSYQQVPNLWNNLEPPVRIARMHPNGTSHNLYTPETGRLFGLDEEERLNDAAASVVAKIREANAKKIMEKRSLGDRPARKEAKAEAAEIRIYKTANCLDIPDEKRRTRLPRVPEQGLKNLQLPPAGDSKLNEMNIGDFIRKQLGIEDPPPKIHHRKPRAPRQKPSNEPTTSQEPVELMPDPSPELSPEPPAFQIEEVNPFEYREPELGTEEEETKPDVSSQPVLEETKPEFLLDQTTSEAKPVSEEPGPVKKNVTRILITRGPNGQIIRKTRIVVRKASSNGLDNQKMVKKVETPELESTPSEPFFDDKEKKANEYEEPVVKDEPVVKEMSELERFKRNLIASTNYQRPPPSPERPPPTWQPGPRAPRPPQNFQPKVIIPKRANKSSKLYDVVRNEKRRSPSPHRIFLGAEEPMKDLASEEGSFKRVVIQKVDSLNFRWDRESDYKSVELEQKEKTPKPNKDSKEELEAKLKKQKEDMRQKQAMAQKPLVNELKVWKYMQSKEFEDSLKSNETASEFEKTISRPNAFAELPEFSDSLTYTNPQLYENLLTIYRAKHDKKFPLKSGSSKFKFIQKRRDRLWKMRGEKGLPPNNENTEARVKNLTENGTKMIPVMINGIHTSLPEHVECHLCDDVMRLCIRKSNYRGELREYPAYRCLRKGCQTFRSVSKQFREQIYLAPPPPVIMVKPSLKPFKLARCDETIDEKIEEIKPKVEEELQMPKLEKSTEELEFKPVLDLNTFESAEDVKRNLSEEDEDLGETVDFEYIGDSKEEESTEDDPDEDEDDVSNYGRLSPYEEEEDDFIVEDPDEDYF